MKKNICIIILLISLIILSFITYNLYSNTYSYKSKINNLENEIKDLNSELENEKEENNSLNTVNEIDSNEYSNLKQINIKTLKKIIDKKESFILLISQKSCSHCITFKPTLNKVLKENSLLAYEIDIEGKFSTFQQEIPSLSDITGTPTTVFFKKGIETKSLRHSGNIAEENLIKILQEAGYLK